MLVETDNLVPVEQFRKNMAKYLAAAREGSGPIAITENAEVVGFYISAAEYEAMFGVAVKQLLSGRAKGPTVSQEEVRDHILEIARRGARKS